MPTFVGRPPDAVHESCLRAWSIVEKVKDVLRVGTPGEVVIELIEEMENSRSSKTLAPRLHGGGYDVEVIQDGQG